jgi:hypothetical protein
MKIVSTWACKLCAFLVVVTLMSYIAYCAFVSCDVHSNMNIMHNKSIQKVHFLWPINERDQNDPSCCSIDIICFDRSHPIVFTMMK